MENDPVVEQIAVAIEAYLIDSELQCVIERHDEAAIRDIIDPGASEDAIQFHVDQAWANSSTKVLSALTAAFRTADSGAKQEILDGAIDYHAAFADLDCQYANEERVKWPTTRADRDQRAVEAGDCVTRVINEAVGGGFYPPIWEEISRLRQNQDPRADADYGAYQDQFRSIMFNYGLRPVVEATYDYGNPLRNYIDLREAPALFEHLFTDPEHPLIYTTCTDTHAQTVVDGTLRDIRDRRTLGDAPLIRQEVALTELWINSTDPQVLDAAHQIIRRYQTVCRYDQVLT